MAAEAKTKLSLQTLTRTLATANNINATTTEVSAALNNIFQAINNYPFKDAQDVNDAVKKNTISTSTFILFNGEVQLVSDVLKLNNK